MDIERPNRADREELEGMLNRDDLTNWEKQFFESLQNWNGAWRPKQVACFDKIVKEKLHP